jgi:hypothetical protein
MALGCSEDSIAKRVRRNEIIDELAVLPDKVWYPMVALASIIAWLAGGDCS